MKLILKDENNRLEKTFDEGATWRELTEGFFELLPALGYILCADAEALADAAYEEHLSHTSLFLGAEKEQLEEDLPPSHHDHEDLE